MILRLDLAHFFLFNEITLTATNELEDEIKLFLVFEKLDKMKNIG